MISKERLEGFKKIYKKRFKKDITDEEALRQATSLLRMVELVYKPMTLGEYTALQKRRLEDGEITEKEFKKFIKNVKCQKSKRVTGR